MVWNESWISISQHHIAGNSPHYCTAVSAGCPITGREPLPHSLEEHLAPSLQSTAAQSPPRTLQSAFCLISPRALSLGSHCDYWSHQGSSVCWHTMGREIKPLLASCFQELQRKEAPPLVFLLQTLHHQGCAQRHRIPGGTWQRIGSHWGLRHTWTPCAMYSRRSDQLASNFCSSLFQKHLQAFMEEGLHSNLLRNPCRTRVWFISSSHAVLGQL